MIAQAPAKPPSKDTAQDPLLAQRLDAEWGVIGAALLAPEDTRRDCGWLNADTFWLQDGAKFWRAFIAGTDPFGLALDMGTMFYGRAVDAMNGLLSWQDGAEYARRMARGTWLDKAQTLALRLATAAKNGDYETVAKLQQELAQGAPAGARKVRNAADVMEAFVLALDAEVRNLPTRIPGIDEAIGGLERQTLSVIAARPSAGKSTLSFQMARNVALQHYKVLFVSLEMSEINLFARAACPLVGITWLDVRKGALRDKPQLKERLRNAAMDLSIDLAPGLLIHDRPVTTGDIWEMCAAERPDMVVIDHLRLVGDKHDSEVKRLGEITWRCKQMAKALDLHIVMLAQLNRNPEAREDTAAPVLTDLRDSGEIEENADVVLMLHPEPAPKDGKPRQFARCDAWLRKARDGKRDVKIELYFDFLCQWFMSKPDLDRHLREHEAHQGGR